MSSAGSESPRTHLLKPPPDVVLEKLCKKGATVARASEFLNELAGRSNTSSKRVPDGITSLCAFIASEQLENKDVSVGLARTSSGLSWDQFWHSVSDVQDILVHAASQSSHFKYSRLPAYLPPCDTCENKKFECVRKIAPSTKCQVCSIRKKVCTRQDNAHERLRKSEDMKTLIDDDSWLSDVESEPERSKDELRAIKHSRSPSPSAQLESLLNDIDESKKVQASVKTLPSPILSPRWTTLEEAASVSTYHTITHHQHLDAERPSSSKRRLDSPSGSSKKRRVDTQISSSPKLPVRSPAYGSSPAVPQKFLTIHDNDRAPVNGSSSILSLRSPLPHKYSRPPSPSSSDDGRDRSKHTLTTHDSVSPSAHRARADERKVLREALQKKAREVVKQVETEGCKGIGLRLHILDMKTRLVELDRIKADPVPSKSSLSALECMLHRAAKAVVASLQSDGCPDVDLRLMVLDLNTRLAEMDKDR